MMLLRRSLLFLVISTLTCNILCALTSYSSQVQNDLRAEASRRAVLPTLLGAPFLTLVASPVNAYSGPQIDVNNAMAREFTAFPGLYPTIATKIVNGAKNSPYKSKRDVYAVLDNDLERERLKQYDGAILINKPDAAIKQFKASQICKYECGSRVSNSYRDSQIKAVQADRDRR